MIRLGVPNCGNKCFEIELRYARALPGRVLLQGRNFAFSSILDPLWLV